MVGLNNSKLGKERSTEKENLASNSYLWLKYYQEELVFCSPRSYSQNDPLYLVQELQAEGKKNQLFF